MQQAAISVLPAGLRDKVAQCRLLVVGAGGIGCELLKNLALTGFQNVEVIDLDTIDVSNLNRQFLFRKKHVGQSKSKVACAAAQQFNEATTIVSHHGNVKDEQFGPGYFARFDLVMNALDNLDARRHVNRMCLAVDVPLLESGSAGYLGQVTAIARDRTECYDCQAKPQPKTFPVCTIRSKPSTPIHCIVWAKMVFGRVFGQGDDIAELADDDAGDHGDENGVGDGDGDGSNDNGDGNGSGNGNGNGKVKQDVSIHVTGWTGDEAGFASFVFSTLFDAEIVRLASMTEMWQSTPAPKPLHLQALLARASQDTGEDATAAASPAAVLPDQRVWDDAECAQRFISAVQRLQNRSRATIDWDKDDDDALDFVTAAANLRACVFGIDRKSRFDVKAYAGNIIPAIATTNAVIAGLVVMEALTLLSQGIASCRTTFLRKAPVNGKLLLPTALEPPNPKCYVCQTGFARVTLDTNTVTASTLLHDVLCAQLGLTTPSVMLQSEIVLEAASSDDLDDMTGAERASFDARLSRPLGSFGIGHNTMLRVSDLDSDLAVELSILHADGVSQDIVAVGRARELRTAAEPEQGGDNDGSGDGGNDDANDDVVVSQKHRSVNSASVLGKRARPTETADELSAKRMKQGVVELD